MDFLAINHIGLHYIYLFSKKETCYYESIVENDNTS